MIRDRRAEMGFMEAIVSMMTVTIVLSLYLAFMATGAASAYDPLSDFDSDELKITQDGVLDEGSESYLSGFIVTHDVCGIGVTYSAPHFIEQAKEFFVGEDTDIRFSHTYMGTCEIFNGRVVPVIFEVRICV